MVTSDHSKRRVSYYYDDNYANYYYSPTHAMKPIRVKMTHDMIMEYGLYSHLQIVRPYPASMNVIRSFHDPGYINFLKEAPYQDTEPTQEQLLKYHFDEDCPLFDGVFELSQMSCGGSFSAAIKLNKKEADIAINWMGGLHHAKKARASGFCYTNDIVIGILELLKFHKRVLYVDIDVHHGDGVEEAFYTTDRVMTVSFHNYDGKFFPKSGRIKDIGAHNGTAYAVNVPLKAGIDDECYQSIFVPVMERVMQRFDPSAIVLQCGADSLNYDVLGPFNLTLRGHGECVSFLRKYNVPIMLLGGGGYTPLNVARCWTYETSLACGKDLPPTIPKVIAQRYYGRNEMLHIEASTITNKNTKKYLNSVREEIFLNLELLNFVPSVQMQPTSSSAMYMTDETSIRVDNADPDIRLPPEIADGIIDHDGEFFDHENDIEDDGDISDEMQSVVKEEKVEIILDWAMTPYQSSHGIQVPCTSTEDLTTQLDHCVIKKESEFSPTPVRRSETSVETQTTIKSEPLSPSPHCKEAPQFMDDMTDVRNGTDMLTNHEVMTNVPDSQSETLLNAQKVPKVDIELMEDISEVSLDEPDCQSKTPLETEKAHKEDIKLMENASEVNLYEPGCQKETSLGTEIVSKEDIKLMEDVLEISQNKSCCQNKASTVTQRMPKGDINLLKKEIDDHIIYEVMEDISVCHSKSKANTIIDNTSEHKLPPTQIASEKKAKLMKDITDVENSTNNPIGYEAIEITPACDNIVSNDTQIKTKPKPLTPPPQNVPKTKGHKPKVKRKTDDLDTHQEVEAGPMNNSQNSLESKIEKSTKPVAPTIQDVVERKTTFMEYAAAVRRRTEAPIDYEAIKNVPVCPFQRYGRLPTPAEFICEREPQRALLQKGLDEYMKRIREGNYTTHSPIPITPVAPPARKRARRNTRAVVKQSGSGK